MKARTVGMAFFGAVVSVTSVGCGPTSNDSNDVSEPLSQRLEADAASPPPQFRHPLADIHGVPGSVPGIDIKNSPEGLRYAVGSVSSAREGEHMVTRSGLFALEHEPMTLEERQVKGIRQAAGWPPDKIAPELRDKIDAEPSALHTVLVRLANPPTHDIVGEVERVIAQGLVHGEDDIIAIRENLKERRRGEISAAQLPVSTLAESFGGVIQYKCENLPCLHLVMRGDVIGRFASETPGIERLYADSTSGKDDIVEGRHTILGSQIAQFIDSGYDGDVDGDPEVAMVEWEGVPDTDHPGFKTDSSSCCGLRVLRRYKCSTIICTQTFSDADESEHATAVAGVLMGDLRDAQDPNVTDPTYRIRRSGYAGESRLYAYRGTGTVSSINVAMDHLYGQSSISIVNMSFATDEDTNCLGESLLSHAVNDLFQAGFAVIKSAGNLLNANSANCTVSDPGSAIGAFTVGAHGENWEASGVAEAEVRDGPITSFTSRGGVSYADGKYRTIIDITAIGGRRLLFDMNGGYGLQAGGTSISAPTVAAMALDFKAHYQDEISMFVNHPGVLYAHLLLMGDRTTEGGFNTSGFSNLWGAGRLQARKFDDAGMDAPWERATDYVCIDDGQNYYVYLNGGSPIPADAGTIKAALWWYDRRHESGTDIDDIDLRLEEDVTGSGAWVTRVISVNHYDNKEFVYALSTPSQFDGHKARLKISGYDVTSDGEGCGTNSMKVYYAYFWEDDDRDDADGPSLSDIDVESEH